MTEQNIATRTADDIQWDLYGELADDLQFTGKEVATLPAPYDPDNDWRKRAWSLDGRDGWEQWAMAALKLRHRNALEESVTQLEELPESEWAQPVQRRRHVPVFYFDGDIITKAGAL